MMPRPARPGSALAALLLVIAAPAWADAPATAPTPGPAPTQKPDTAPVAEKLDRVPRTVVMTAFSPEWEALVHVVEGATEYRINGTIFVTGTMTGKPVLLMQSGVSMVNAAMNTQLVLDRFTVSRLVFSGIAGGVDPSLSIGDVIVPTQWGEYLEVSFARRTAKGWVVPEPVDPEAPAHWDMMFPRGVRLGNAAEPAHRQYLLAVDPALLALARKVSADVRLQRCVAADGAAIAAPGRRDAAQRSAAPTNCLPRPPRVVIGGTGVSAGVYADNAAFRGYLFSAWHARVLDMESAAVAQVAYANRVPVIVFRSLSDLAGGDAGANQMTVFMTLASVNSAAVVRSFVSALPD